MCDKNLNHFPEPKKMVDYIERQKVLDMLDNAQLISDSAGIYCGYCTEDVNIIDIPAAQVREDVQGEWDLDERCTVCGEKSTEGLDAEKWNYWCPDFCPHCGARMRNEQ